MSSGLSNCRAVVAKAVRKSSPPNAILVMFATGKRTVCEQVAGGRIAARFPARVEAIQTQPSLSIVGPSG